MNAPSAQAGSSNEDSDARCWFWALMALAVCLVAISRQSLWIDEAFMASKAAQPTLAGWWQMMPEGKGSDLQMPLYMIYMWGFARIFGISEWALRAANIPWFVAGVAAFIRVAPPRQKLAAAAAALCAPFAWFYLNEGRPYTMQLGASLILFAALRQLSSPSAAARNEGKWFVAFCFGIVTLCGSSLLGVIWTGAALLCAPFLFPVRRLLELLRAHFVSSLITSALLAALAVYYVWTLHAGHDSQSDQAGNSALGVIKTAAHFRQGLAGGTDARNLAFLAYELLGLGGLGPGRVEIRVAGVSAFRPFMLPLGLFALVTFGVLVIAASQFWRSPNRAKWLGTAAVIALPMLLLLGAGYFLSFRILGRHITPLMPVLVCLMSLGLTTLWARRDFFSKLLAVLFIALSVASCLSFRFAARHEKDDYRDAAAMANAALQGGQQVWWSADAHGAVYYHVPLNSGAGNATGAVLVQNPSTETLSRLAAPDVIVSSKPDLYDSGGAIADYLSARHYLKVATLQAFTIWRRPGASAVLNPAQMANLIE